MGIREDFPSSSALNTDEVKQHKPLRNNLRTPESFLAAAH